MVTKIREADQDYLRRFGDRLTDSSQRAKWVSDPDTHEDHEGQTLVTRNHDVITRWAEERGARPATVPGTERGRRPSVLRFDFPGYSEGELEEIGWSEWFETFDTRDLVMLYQEHLKNGNQSNFFRFDSPHREDG